jgi:hypothetical protein
MRSGGSALSPNSRTASLRYGPTRKAFFRSNATSPKRYGSMRVRSLRARRRLGLLWAQRHRRCGPRCRSAGPCGSQTAGAPAMDARRRVRLRAIWPGHACARKVSLDANGKIVDWVYEVWSNTHSTRPAAPDGDNSLLASWYLAEPSQPGPPTNIPQPAGGGDRNARCRFTICPISEWSIT